MAGFLPVVHKHYQPGKAAREAEMFPSNRAGLLVPGEMDPGLAWCESVREVDPDLSITLALLYDMTGPVA
ncbi:MAG: hypothetical protein ABSE91_00415 [Patescibacteria group bacterium]